MQRGLREAAVHHPAEGVEGAAHVRGLGAGLRHRGELELHGRGLGAAARGAAGGEGGVAGGFEGPVAAEGEAELGRQAAGRGLLFDTAESVHFPGRRGLLRSGREAVLRGFEFRFARQRERVRQLGGRILT